MIRLSPWRVLPLLLISSAVPAPAEAADDANSGAAMYSHGVHSYFSGNLNRADIYLYRAAELNPADPRPYYFRGLVLRRLGRTWEADEVMQEGAAIETNGNASAFGIGESLQRVQGADRLRLEQFRRAARLNHTNVAAENARRRYEQRPRIQATVERRPVRLPLDALINPVEPNQLAELIVPVDALSEEPPTPEAPAVEITIDTEEMIAADEGDPFADDPETPTTVASPPPAAPEAAAGSVKAGSLPGIFGRILGRQLPTVDVDRFRGMVPGIGGGAPPGMPEGFGGEAPPDTDPFGGPEMPAESADSPAEIPATPPTDEGENPF